MPDFARLGLDSCFLILGSSKRVFCPVPKPLVNGTIGGNRVSVSAFIKYTCDKDFELKGPTRRICQRNGRWSREDPYCEPKCKSTFLPPF